MGVGLEQGLVFVLAVNVDQQFTECLEVAKGAGRAIDIATRASFGGDDPAQDAGAFVVQVAFDEPVARFRDVLQVEGGQDVGLVRPGAHHAAVGTITQGQAESIEHDRLAGTGFAGDDAHPAIQFQIEVLDDCVIVYGQVHQHEGRSQGLIWLFIQWFRFA